MYKKGVEMDVFIKNMDGDDMFGWVWPKTVHFADFFHPNGSKFWKEGMQHLYDKIKFSGIWLDMNELANFC